ncbi:MAG: hypothetical protein AB1758_02300 [Candidatus Eremiobacterota bacterium]
MEKIHRKVGGRDLEISLTIDSGGSGWVVTVRHETRVIARGVGDSRDEVLSRVLNELRQRFQGEPLVLTVNPDIFLQRKLPMGEPLRQGKGKLPSRWA